MNTYLDFLANVIISDYNTYTHASTVWWIFMSIGFTIFTMIKFAVLTCPIWIPFKLILAEINPGNKKSAVFNTTINDKKK